MSQSSKHVKWCMNKAEKELEECKRLGKRPRHRGLIKTEPSIYRAKEHIEKAEHDFRALMLNKENGFYDWAINIGFYVIYHCFLAIAIKFGYESRNQTCTISLIEQLNEEGRIDIDARFIDMLKYEEDAEKEHSRVIELREEYTYGVKISADEAKIVDLIETCREMIDVTKEMVYKR